LNSRVIEPKQKAKACVIWMHGLGSNADDMAGLAEQLPLTVPVRHVSLNAPIRPVTMNQNMPMPAWYDIAGIKITDREDRDGILASKTRIVETVQAQISDGFLARQIFLAGFSQGGAMALFASVNGLPTLGGVLALSAYLPLADTCEVMLDTKTPMFIASGRLDNVVLPAWTASSVSWLQRQGFDALTVRDYAMEHSVCIEEVKDIAVWLEGELS
jgi:phospholipase/carboxylesterase